MCVQVRAAAVREKNRKQNLGVDKVKVEEIDLRRSVLHKVARSRARRYRSVERQQHASTVDGTLRAVWQQANGETAQV